MNMTVHHPDASPEQLTRALAAALEVFQRAGVEPLHALEAIDKEELWDGSRFDDRYALTPTELHVLEVMRRWRPTRRWEICPVRPPRSSLISEDPRPLLPAVRRIRTFMAQGGDVDDAVAAARLSKHTVWSMFNVKAKC